ncbi:uncharacterized protein LOC127808111 [Diospyros lotus]|uniref:uncharacterized protein LOC127808111 n=1 Tax=Diospyros lotus TaxID=55363 RepID=UPI00224E1A83|nr:uncharacterized protein LOC127808111 [Diospyros lotus]
MPSGAKRRKAAKKKMKEQEAASTAHSHGDDDLKVHDEKDSDGGEAASPASQDQHNHQHPFAEGEEEDAMEKAENTSSAQLIVPENETVVGVDSNGEINLKVEIEENNSTIIEPKLEPEHASSRKNVRIEDVESVNESHGGQMTQYGESSGSSSSDDESHVIEKNIVVIESCESKDAAAMTVEESSSFADPIKTDDFPEVTQVSEGIAYSDAYNLAAEEQKEKAHDSAAVNALPVNLVKLADLPEAAQVTDALPIPEPISLVVVESTEEAPIPSAETIPVLTSENASNNVIHVNDDPIVEKVIGPNEIELGLKENGKTEISEVSLGVDMGSQEKEDKLSTTTAENSADLLIAVSFAAEGEEDKCLSSSGAPAVDSRNDAEHKNDSVITEFSERQPAVASAARPVQTSSWTSCCGLFELFTGSGR